MTTHYVGDTAVLTGRTMRHVTRSLDTIITTAVMPVAIMLLFVYVFGGAINLSGFPGSYVDFLLPGILVQNICFGGALTAVGLTEDLNKGLIDRFRSLPMARSAVLAGRTFADVVVNLCSIAIMVAVGLIVGFSFHASALDIVAGVLLLLLFGYAFSWVFALIGLTAHSAETAQQFGFTVIFPLTFISSAFVPVESMPSALEAFAKVNPFTITVDAMRSLFLGTPAGDSIWQATLWGIGLVAVFAPLAVLKYRRVSAR